MHKWNSMMLLETFDELIEKFINKENLMMLIIVKICLETLDR